MSLVLYEICAMLSGIIALYHKDVDHWILGLKLISPYNCTVHGKKTGNYEEWYH